MEQVLLIECHPLLRSALQDLLARNGFACVLVASTPVEAVREALKQSPRIIVLDTTVPEMEGFYLSHMLRELAPQSKIVLLLENTGADYQAAVRSSGADAFVSKSALTQELPLLLTEWQGDQPSR